MIQNNVIATVFFSGKIDPQRNIKYSSDFDYVERWYSCVRDLDMNAVIFHDCLADDVVGCFSTEKIKFVKVDSYRHQNFCAADYRWILYYDYFMSNKFDNIFVTDCNDVIVKCPPFHLIKENQICIGEECDVPSLGLVNVIGKSPWCRGVYSYAYANFHYWDRGILNCGIVGAKYNDFIFFVGKMKSEILRINPQKSDCDELGIPFTIDMAVLSYVAYTYFDGRIISGFPLHSDYKKYQLDRSDVCLIHK